MMRLWPLYAFVVACLGSMLTAAALVPESAAAASKSSRLALHLKWQQVTPGPAQVSTSDRYAAVWQCPGPANSCTQELSLVDEQTRQQQVLSVPASCGPDYRPDGFGGPWLVVVCTGAFHWLYNLNSQQWVPVSPNCPADCSLIGVGRYWLKFASNGNPGCVEHCGESFYLQNLQTGQVELGPAKPGERTFDDLNSPTGAVPLCAPLRYPTFHIADLGLSVIGSLQFAGSFALAGSGAGTAPAVEDSFHLLRCGSRRALAVQDQSSNYAPFISSRAVVWRARRQEHCKKRSFGLACTSHYYIRGLYLHGLREFSASLPTPPSIYAGPGEVVGLTQRTIYVEAPNESLWSAPLPPPNGRT